LDWGGRFYRRLDSPPQSRWGTLKRGMTPYRVAQRDELTVFACISWVGRNATFDFQNSRRIEFSIDCSVEH
jgi:hypothetical protein